MKIDFKLMGKSDFIIDVNEGEKWTLKELNPNGQLELYFWIINQQKQKGDLGK